MSKKRIDSILHPGLSQGFYLIQTGVYVFLSSCPFNEWQCLTSASQYQPDGTQLKAPHKPTLMQLSLLHFMNWEASVIDANESFPYVDKLLVHCVTPSFPTEYDEAGG